MNPFFIIGLSATMLVAWIIGDNALNGAIIPRIITRYRYFRKKYHHR